MTVEFAQILRKSMVESGIDSTQLAKKTKLKEDKINDFLVGNKDASTNETSKLIKVLKPTDNLLFEVYAGGYVPIEYHKALETPGIISVIVIPGEGSFSRVPKD